jgi:toxin ParE1/3/4
MPEMGARREYQNPTLAGVRMWRITGFDNYLVFYRPTERGIEIIRVLHAKRDIDALFGGRS